MNDDEEFRFHPERFESRSWIRITSMFGYPGAQPLAVELEAAPRDNRKGNTLAQPIIVIDPEAGWLVRAHLYPSVTEAIKHHGRAVRSSLETENAYGRVKALRINITPGTLPGGNNVS